MEPIKNILNVTTSYLQDTLEAASFLQILPVLDFCKVFLISGVSLDNCVEVGRIANTYNLIDIIQISKKLPILGSFKTRHSFL